MCVKSRWNAVKYFIPYVTIYKKAFFFFFKSVNKKVEFQNEILRKEIEENIHITNIYFIITENIFSLVNIVYGFTNAF